MADPARVDIGEDEPVTLAEACRLFFGGRLTPSALRTEASKGNLSIMQIARKDFVTRGAIEEMKARCLRSASPPDCGSEPKKARTESRDRPGSSETVNGAFAQDALRRRLQKRKDLLPITSPKNTKLPAAVVHLKSQ